MKTYLFYDLETSGLDPCFDQILTFAAVRTDTNLNIIDKSSNTVKLRPDIIPSPYAFITHCLTGGTLDQGINEFAAARSLHKLFNTPGTISIGYNSLGFDDEFIRFLFYRNLFEPYTHQYANQCGRMDMLPITTLFYLFCPEVLKWPIGKNAQPSLKLELLSQANQFATSGRAHEAMADVEALIALFKILSQKKEIFKYAADSFSPDIDLLRKSKFNQDIVIGGQTFSSALMISNSFGNASNYMAPVICIGSSTAYKNQMLYLRLDTPKQTTFINEQTNRYDWFVIRKRAGDQWLLLPFLERFRNRLSEKAHKAYSESITNFQNNPEVFIETCIHHKNYKYPDIPNIDPDADLYQSGFFSREEKYDIQIFQETPDENKSDTAGKLNTNRIRKLAQRIVDRNFSGNLFSPEMISHLERLNEDTVPIKNYRNEKKISKPFALRQLSQIKKQISTLDAEQKKAFYWVSEYINNFNGYT